MPPKKISGSELLAELQTESLERTAPAPLAPASAPAAGGRPSKVGGKAVPLTMRVSEDQLARLRDAALDVSKAHGGKTVTPQDVVRMLIDRALADPAFPAFLIEDRS